jgi:hypothetical protein
VIEDLLAARQDAAKQIEAAQRQQKKSFDRKRKAPRKYKEGDPGCNREKLDGYGHESKTTTPVQWSHGN